MNFITGSVHIKWRFTASWFGNIRCARLWLTITTFSASRWSAVVEIAAGDDRDAERREEARRHRAEPRARIFFAVGLRVAFGRELERPDRTCRHRATARCVPTAARSTPGSSEMRRSASL